MIAFIHAEIFFNKTQHSFFQHPIQCKIDESIKLFIFNFRLKKKLQKCQFPYNCHLVFSNVNILENQNTVIKTSKLTLI